MTAPVRGHAFEPAYVAHGFKRVPVNACGHVESDPAGDVGGFCTRPADDPIHNINNERTTR